MRNMIWQKGFTLVELVVTIAVLCIVLTIATVSFKDTIWRNQVNTAANDLISAFNYARSEAVTRSVVVAACRSENVNETVPSCSTGISGWETGYIVFVDTNGNGSRDTGEDLLRVFAGPKGNVTMIGDANVANNIRYAATGFLFSGGSGTVEVKNDSKTIDVVLSQNGRVASD